MIPIEVICHKGANEYAPENTYASTQLCIDWGMDYVEIDVNTSKDGVLYLLHGPEIDHTTDGTGMIHELSSKQIDRLDAGSWFDPEFSGERVPRLKPFLQWVKGKIKVFFDVKSAADVQRVIELVYATGMELDCFFWFDTLLSTVRFRRLDRQLALKINVSKPEHVVLAVEEFGASIVETGLTKMSQELLDTCREWGVTLMVNHCKKDPDAFRRIVEWGVDMVNVDHGDLFAQIAEKWYESQRSNWTQT